MCHQELGEIIQKHTNSRVCAVCFYFIFRSLSITFIHISVQRNFRLSSNISKSNLYGLARQLIQTSFVSKKKNQLNQIWPGKIGSRQWPNFLFTSNWFRSHFTFENIYFLVIYKKRNKILYAIIQL